MTRKCEIELDRVLRAIISAKGDYNGPLYDLAAELIGFYLSDEEIDSFADREYPSRLENVYKEEALSILYSFQRCYITHGV